MKRIVLAKPESVYQSKEQRQEIIQPSAMQVGNLSANRLNNAVATMVSGIRIKPNYCLCLPVDKRQSKCKRVPDRKSRYQYQHLFPVAQEVNGWECCNEYIWSKGIPTGWYDAIPIQNKT